jgi:hypothetical protein
MEAKTGDRVALDGKKVGQPKRHGVIRNVSKGISGLRYSVEWDDGTQSIISPSLGNLTVQPAKARKTAKAPAKPAKKAKARR